MAFAVFATLLDKVIGFDLDKYPLIGGIAFSAYLMMVAILLLDVYRFGNLINLTWYPALREAFYKESGIVHGFASTAFFFSVAIFFFSFYSLYKRRKEGKQRKINEAIAQKQKQEEDRINAEKQQEQEEWQKQLDREIERERRLAEVRHESTLMAMQAQIKLYGEYKEKGLDIEKQIFDMRKNLIELEGQENKAMLDEVRQALDDLDT
jgi:type III secretory pathway component EscV